MVLRTALRRYEYLDSLFNPFVLRLEKSGVKYPKYAIVFGLDRKDKATRMETTKDFEKLIGWKE